MLIVIACVAVLFTVSGVAQAYFDPGTSAAVYGILSPILSFLALCLGLLWRPIKRM